jgi:predicted amidohydrolase
MQLDYADLFAALYDEVDAAAFRRSAERLLDDPAVEVLAQRTSNAAARGELSEGWVGAALGRGAHHDRTRLALLLGLDRAFARIDPLRPAHQTSRALREYASRYRERGRLDSGSGPGALLPRFVRPGRDTQLPSDLRDAFHMVVRVSAEDWERTDHLVLPPHGPFDTPRRDRLVVGTTPLVADPAELLWEVHSRRERRFYRIYPRDAEATRRRIRDVVAGFDAGGVHIGLAPEATLTPALLSEWQRALRERPGADRSELRLVLAGSGNIDEVDPPSNTAVLLDARTGEVLLRQRKLFRFSLFADDLEHWRLIDRLGGDAIDEDLEPGERLTIVETGWGRLAVLICEDLARVPALAQPLHAHNVSLILVPVFSRPTRAHRWEHVHAQNYSDSTGTSIVAANSLVMASVLGGDPAPGTAIAVSPAGATIGHAASPAEVVRFELAPGAAPALLGATAAEEVEPEQRAAPRRTGRSPRRARWLPEFAT